MDRNLTAFLAVADAGNLTLASEKIGLTQPSLTKRLNNLELELGSKLFNRHRRGMILTAAGELYYEHARRVENDFLQTSEALRGLEEAGIDVLRVAAGPLYHQLYLATVFDKVRQQFPGLKLDVIVETAEQSLSRLMKDEIDIILGVFQPGSRYENVTIIPYTIIEHGLVIRQSDFPVKVTSLKPTELKELQWVLYLDDPDSENWLNGYFAKNDLGVPNIVVRTESFATGLSLVRDTGYVMMTPTQLSPVIETGDLQVISTTPPISKLQTGAYIRSSSKSTRAIMSFVDLMEDQIRNGN